MENEQRLMNIVHSDCLEEIPKTQKFNDKSRKHGMRNV